MPGWHLSSREALDEATSKVGLTNLMRPRPRLAPVSHRASLAVLPALEMTRRSFCRRRFLRRRGRLADFVPGGAGSPGVLARCCALQRQRIKTGWEPLLMSPGR